MIRNLLNFFQIFRLFNNVNNVSLVRENMIRRRIFFVVEVGGMLGEVSSDGRSRKKWKKSQGYIQSHKFQ